MQRENMVMIAVLGVACIIAFAYHVWVSTTQMRIVKHEYGDYCVLEVFNVLSKSECKDLISYSEKNNMQPSSVLSYGSNGDTAVDKDSRKSTTLWIKDEAHPCAKKMARISAELTGVPDDQQEMLQVVKYEPGGKFNPHFDACDIEDDEYKRRINNNAGQRSATFLFYLNDEYTGGETEFVDLGLKIKPEVGKAILFWDTDKSETILPKSKHMGCTVVGGNKWICTKWSHPGKWMH